MADNAKPADPSADDQNLQGQKQDPKTEEGAEASAQDLMSLWGASAPPGGESASMPAGSQPAPSVEPEPILPPEPESSLPEPSAAPPEPIEPVQELPPQEPAQEGYVQPEPKLQALSEEKFTPSPAQPAAESASAQEPPEDIFANWGQTGYSGSQPADFSPPPADISSQPAEIDIFGDKPQEPEQNVEEEYKDEYGDEQQKPVGKELAAEEPAQEESAAEDATVPFEETGERPPSSAVIEGELVSSHQEAAEEPAVEEAPHSLEPESAFEEFLHELNLSKKHIYYGIGCLILVIGLIWGGFKGFQYYKNQKTQPLPQARPPSEILAGETGLPSTRGIGGNAAVAPQIVGQTGIFSASAIGAAAESSELPAGIADFVMVFRRIQNAYEVNVAELLDKSTDRPARLQNHLALLKKLYQDGAKTLDEITQEMEKIRVEYDLQTQKQQEDDENFFIQLNDLNARNAQNVLEDFITVSKDLVDLKARFKALEKLQEFYDRGLPRLQTRVRAIELNFDALVSGIKVYDIGASDLNLIVPLEGESDREESSSNAFPFLGPLETGARRDFITQPGGGSFNVPGINQTGTSAQNSQNR